MRFKVLTIFVGFQLAAFGLYSGVQAFWPSFKQSVAIQAEPPLKPSAIIPGLHLTAENPEKGIIEIPVGTREAISQTVAALPQEHTQSLEKIVLKYDPKAGRGLGGARTILLKSHGVSAQELNAVLIHEIGHTVDLGYLNAPRPTQSSEFKDGDQPIYAGDPSLDFYRISWDNEKQIKNSAGNFDFVSGYAMSDPFEDFAESYAFYVLHNQEFRYLASTNDALLAKYAFIKNKVFKGQEFRDSKKQEFNAFRRVWDVTALPYDN